MGEKENKIQLLEKEHNVAFSNLKEESNNQQCDYETRINQVKQNSEESAKEIDELKSELKYAEEKNKFQSEDLHSKQQQLENITEEMTQKEEFFRQQTEDLKNQLESEKISLKASENLVLEKENKIQTLEKEHKDALSNLKEERNNQECDYEAQIEQVKQNSKEKAKEVDELRSELKVSEEKIYVNQTTFIQSSNNCKTLL